MGHDRLYYKQRRNEFVAIKQDDTGKEKHRI